MRFQYGHGPLDQMFVQVHVLVHLGQEDAALPVGQEPGAEEFHIGIFF